MALFILVITIVVMSLVWGSVTTTINWLPCYVFGSGPNMSIQMNLNGPLGETVLAAVGACHAYGSACKRNSHVQ